MNVQQLEVGATEAGGLDGPQAPSHPGVSRGCILVIDNHSGVRDAVELGLERLGFTTLTAWDADHALEIFRENCADIVCVLTVLALPGTAGHTMVGKLREAGPTTPILVMSGYQSMAMAGQLGDSATRLAAEHLLERPEDPLTLFLAKPFGVTGLRDALDQLLP